jgi:hypothetical protein
MECTRRRWGWEQECQCYARARELKAQGMKVFDIQPILVEEFGLTPKSAGQIAATAGGQFDDTMPQPPPQRENLPKFLRDWLAET